MRIHKKIYDYFFNNRRKKKVIDKPTQLQMAVEMLLHILMFVFLMIFLLYVDPMATLFSHHTLDEHQQAVQWLLEVNSGKWPLLIFAGVILVIVSIHFSHRITGPAFKIEMMLRKYATRDLREPTYLRTHDYLTNIPPPINDLRAVVNGDLIELRQTLESLMAKINTIRDGSEKDQLLSLCQKLADKIRAYQLDEKGTSLKE